MWQGSVVSIHIATEAAGPMVTVAEARATPGKGLEGDRYFKAAGTYSDRPGPGRQVTLIEVEAMEALARDAGIQLAPSETRRNIATRGVPLNHLVGQEFRVGEVLVRGIRLCEPCRHLEGLVQKSVLAPLVHRGGLRVDILSGGVIRVGDVIRPASA